MKEKMVVLIVVFSTAVIISGLVLYLILIYLSNYGIDLKYMAGMIKGKFVKERGLKDIKIYEEDYGNFKGFSKELFVSDLKNPTSVCFDQKNWLYIAEDKTGNIIRVKDFDNDNKAEEKQVFASNFKHPKGVQYYNGKLYVSSQGKISELIDIDFDGKSDKENILISGLPYGNNQTNDIIIYNNFLYAAQGARSDHGEKEITKYEGSIIKINLKTKQASVYAKGFHNPYDLAFHPVTGEMFAGDDSRKIPAKNYFDELNFVFENEDYGWPDCYGNYRGKNCKKTVFSLVEFVKGASPRGMLFYQKDNFPPPYKNNLFICLMGSKNNDPDIGKSVIRAKLIPVTSGYSAEIYPFAEGLNKPIDITDDKNGALYIADYQQGKVYKIWAKYK